jgi:hypothetical protein
MHLAVDQTTTMLALDGLARQTRLAEVKILLS